MMNYLLVFSSFALLLIPSYLMYLNANRNYVDYLLFSLLCVQFVLSLLFWINPVKNTPIHKIDAIFAKISSAIFILYIFFVKPADTVVKYAHTLVFISTLLFLYLSNAYSTKGWCSRNHIICHFILHIFGILTAIFVFIPSPSEIEP